MANKRKHNCTKTNPIKKTRQNTEVGIFDLKCSMCGGGSFDYDEEKELYACTYCGNTLTKNINFSIDMEKPHEIETVSQTPINVTEEYYDDESDDIAEEITAHVEKHEHKMILSVFIICATAALIIGIFVFIASSKLIKSIENSVDMELNEFNNNTAVQTTTPQPTVPVKEPEIITIQDSVDFTGLTPNQEYRLEYSVVDTSGNTILNTGSTTFTPAEENGAVTVSINVDKNNISDESNLAFQSTLIEPIVTAAPTEQPSHEPLTETKTETEEWLEKYFGEGSFGRLVVMMFGMIIVIILIFEISKVLMRG